MERSLNLWARYATIPVAARFGPTLRLELDPMAMNKKRTQLSACVSHLLECVQLRDSFTVVIFIDVYIYIYICIFMYIFMSVCKYLFISCIYAFASFQLLPFFTCSGARSRSNDKLDQDSWLTGHSNGTAFRFLSFAPSIPHFSVFEWLQHGLASEHRMHCHQPVST